MSIVYPAPFENTHLYSLHEFVRASIAPLRQWARINKDFQRSMFNPMRHTLAGRQAAAGFELIERLTQRYEKPEFGIKNTNIEGHQVHVHEEIVEARPFCNLIRFRRETRKKHPKLLIVAPMSGHHATLLRGTVKGFLPFHDVYITDWIDARDVAMYQGDFDLDDYIDYVIDHIRLLGPNCHVLAVCQPAVPVLAAAAILADEDPKAAPRSMTLMGGPIDTRVGATQVNALAEEKPLEWFEANVVTRVPFNYPGFMRRVYPGFIQLTGFMQMNLDRHIGEHIRLFNHLVDGDGESAYAHKLFYNEYLSVMDLPAEFYLQTIQTVFKDHALPKGEMVSRGRKVDPSKIKKTALLTIEGERDDISGPGQTKAAQTLCSGLAPEKKKHRTQKSVGHYGIFNGRRFRKHIRPLVSNFIATHHKG